MKVLHILQSNQFSGAENVVCQIISMCKDHDIEFAYCSKDGPIRDALDERGIDFHPIKSLSIAEIRRVLKDVRPDIIHAHDMGASFFASLACGKIPLISHVHNNAFNSRGVSIKSILYYLSAKKAKHIFWVSQSSYEGYAFHSHFKNKSSVLYNVIDATALKTKLANDPKSYKFDIVYLGRLTPQKNPHRLMEVFRIIADKRPDIKMAVIGTGELEDEIKLFAKALKLMNNVTFLGFQSNPTKMLHDAKVLIMTSRWEGTPMCALEAMSLGVPIVCTPTDGLKDVVAEGKTGYLSDDNEVLAQKCIDLVTNSELHSRMSIDSENRASEMMNIKKYAEAILDEYILKG